MSDFDDFIEESLKGIKGLFRTTLEDYRDEISSDTKAFLEKNKEDLKTWTEQLVAGDLSKKDFEDLVLGRKDVAEMYALKEAGLAQAKMDLFKCRLADLLIDTAFDIIA
jgi:hypothetical protein